MSQQFSHYRPWKLILFCLPGLIILLLLIVYDLFLHNFAAVIPNQVYRSRELSKQQFVKTIQSYHIKTIINLRGKNSGQQWYQQELEAAVKTHIHHYDIALQSQTLPKRKQLKRLVHLLQDSQRPLLIHCQSGVDRTGLAAVMTKILQNAPMSKIQYQVSWHYFTFYHQSVGKQLLRCYQNWLNKHNDTTSRINFSNWLNQYQAKQC